MADRRVTVSVLTGLLNGLETRLNNRLAGFAIALDGLEARTNARFNALEGGTGARFDEMVGHIDGLYHRMDRLETEYHAMVLGMKRIEDRLG